MPTVRIHNTVANASIKSSFPNARVSSFQTGRTGDRAILPGMPIGLLLALTYSEPHSINNYGDYRPTVRITST